MTPGSRLEAIGQGLFRYRSWFPPLVLGALIPGLRHANPAAPPGLEPRWATVGLGLAGLGLAVRAVVVGTAPRGTSGRNTNRQIATTLNTSGLYSVVRHPLYLGNLFLWLGPAVATGRWWAPVVTLVAFGGFYGVIIATEDAFLARQFGSAFTTWAEKTPALIPRPRLWQPPGLPFSWSTVARQEYYGFVTTVFFFALLDVASRWRNTGSFGIGTGWLTLLLIAVLVSAPLRVLQRYTTTLDRPGR